MTSRVAWIAGSHRTPEVKTHMIFTHTNALLQSIKNVVPCSAVAERVAAALQGQSTEPKNREEGIYGGFIDALRAQCRLHSLVKYLRKAWWDHVRSYFSCYTSLSKAYNNIVCNRCQWKLAGTARH